jgi:hypothetical protein
MVMTIASAAVATATLVSLHPANPNVDRDLVKPIPDQATNFTLRHVPQAACR